MKLLRCAPALALALVLVFTLSACDWMNSLGDRPDLGTFLIPVPGSLAAETDAAAAQAAPRAADDASHGIFDPAREATKIAKRATEFATELLVRIQTEVIENDALWSYLLANGVVEHEATETQTRVKLTRSGDEYTLQYWKDGQKIVHLEFTRDSGNWNGSLIASFTPAGWTEPVLVRVDFNAPVEGYRSSSVSLSGLGGDPAVTENVPLSAVIDLSEQADGYTGAAGTICYGNIFANDADPLATYYRSFIDSGAAVSATVAPWTSPVGGAYVYRGRAKDGQAAVDFALVADGLASVTASTFETNDIASVVEAAAIQFIKDEYPTETSGYSDPAILTFIENNADETLGWALTLENHVYFAEELFVGTQSASTPLWAAAWAEGLDAIACPAPLDVGTLSITMPADE